jgi:hypothetical protein
LLRAKPLENIWYGMIFSHQSAFVKRSDLIKNPFDLKYCLASDFNQMLALFIQNKKFSYLPIVVANVIIGGLSYSSTITIKEEIRIVHSFKPFSSKLFYFSFLFLLASLKKLFSSSMLAKIRKMRWKYNKHQQS